MLTPSHFELLTAIEAHVAEHGITPSYQDLADAIGLKAKSGVYRMLNCLEERGYIRRLPNKARAIEVIRRPGEAYVPRVSSDAAFVSAAREFLPPDQFAAVAALAHGGSGIADDIAKVMGGVQ